MPIGLPACITLRAPIMKRPRAIGYSLAAKVDRFFAAVKMRGDRRGLSGH
ncbi:hypothetical protein GWG65_02650 [Bradyrhizobium sp. CSA207]|nr:hypothetical protein [Bradyrhizobium sp. CSA207]MDE5440362.1 hypothetical protein [Bradyrhizobium sp. CSA207]